MAKDRALGITHQHEDPDQHFRLVGSAIQVALKVRVS